MTREVLDRARALSPDLLARILHQERLPWLLPEDHALRMKGLRLVRGETA